MDHPDASLPISTLAIPTVPALTRLFTVPVVAAIVGAEDLHPRLFPEERAVAARWLPKRQIEFAAGRHAARRVLAALGCQPRALPRRPDGTVPWPSGTTGSITHCGRFCCAVAASLDVAEGIGIDAEIRRALPKRLADSILTPGERAFRRELPSKLAELWPILAFSAKESFYKCYFPLAGTRLEAEDVAIELESSASVAMGGFRVALLRPDLPLAGRSRHCRGRYLFTERLVVTGATLATP